MEPIIRTDLHLYMGRRLGWKHCQFIIATSLDEAIDKNIRSDKSLAESCGITREHFLADETKPVEDYAHLINPDTEHIYTVLIRDVRDLYNYQRSEYQIYCIENNFPGFCIANSYESAEKFLYTPTSYNLSPRLCPVGLVQFMYHDFFIERMKK